MAGYGNPALSQTWENAYASIKAKLLATASADDGQCLIEVYLITGARREGWAHLVNDVVKQLLTMPRALEALAEGWQEIHEYGCSYGATLPEVEALLQPYTAKLQERVSVPNKQRLL